ncbi:MAG TPA: NADPH:quinone oxidoreductase family protein [Gaiellaceae bacterium]|nr:NADPH:quinone oxidoreductase family protein [Gaiellaceae bacterium]
MRALLLTGTGGTELLAVAEVPDASPVAGEVLVRVAAASVNYADILIRQGRYPLPPELPAVLGMEVAGDVVAADTGSGFSAGDRVMALTLPGRGFAELVAVPAATTFPLPAGMSYAEGSAFLLAFLTAFIPLTVQLRLGAGDTLLVHAAGGGVGTATVQLGRQLGARVLATAGTEEKLAVARELGAAVTVDYSREDWADRIREETAGAGVDAIVDPVGGEVFRQSLSLLRPLGAIAAIGFSAGTWEPIDPALLVGRNVAVHGFYLGRLARLRPDAVADAVASLVALWEAGEIRPYVGAEFSLDDAPAAHALVEERRHIGKVVVLP